MLFCFCLDDGAGSGGGSDTDAISGGDDEDAIGGGDDDDAGGGGGDDDAIDGSDDYVIDGDDAAVGGGAANQLCPMIGLCTCAKQAIRGVVREHQTSDKYKFQNINLTNTNYLSQKPGRFSNLIYVQCIS